MGKHGRKGRGYRSSYGGRDDHGQGMKGGPADYYESPRLPRKLPMVVVLVGLVLWSLLAGIAYAVVDPILGWIAGNAGLLVGGGKDLATATGAGKEVGSILDGLNVSSFLGQTIQLLRVVLKPAIVVLWGIGVLAIFAAPLILPKMVRLLATRRH